MSCRTLYRILVGRCKGACPSRIIHRNFSEEVTVNWKYLKTGEVKVTKVIVGVNIMENAHRNEIDIEGE